MFDETEILTIDVISDVICPWCYIGKKRLEKGLALRPDVATEIRWRPYQLDPTIPMGGIDRQLYMLQKFGDPHKIVEMHKRIATVGLEEGIHFNFAAIERSPHTLDAHRMIRWAYDVGLVDEVVSGLFRAFFEDGRDIGDHEVLADIGNIAGMRPEGVAKMLASDDDKNTVSMEFMQAQQMGIRGVPCFIFGSQVAVNGAETPETIAMAIDAALEELNGPIDPE